MKTMRDVAERAKVSATTVSMVLNGRQPRGGPISAETQQRVLDAAKDLGYRRNALVQAVVSGHNRALGFLAGHIGHEFTARILSGAVDEAARAGYSMQVLRLQNSSLDRQVIERCFEMRLAGLIALDIDPDALEYLRTEMEPQAVPIAFLDTSYHRDWGIHVVTDDEMGCRLALEHLRELGHRRIAFIGGDPGRGMSHLRELFFRQIALEMRLDTRPEYVAHGYWSPDKAFDITLDMMNLPHPPTAILCANDEMALGVQRAGRHLGLKLPDQLSVIGFSNLALAKLCDPALTTVAQPMEEMGEQATRLLLDVVLGNGKGADVWGSSTKKILATHLMVRKSTGRVG